MFDTAAALCRVLEKKVELGLKTREAYTEKNTRKLKELTSEYDDVISLTENLYKLYERQWMRENKPHGFDVQDIRIGGLIQRLKHLKLQIERFAGSEVDRLEELEEPLLDIKGREAGGYIEFNNWQHTATSDMI